MVQEHTEHTRRIAKNTLMLYFRMFFMMLLGLFTSRIVLDALGENDYGVYNVVGGVVAMFSVLSGSLTTAAGRFITFELGRGSEARLGKVYSTSVSVQFILSLIVIILAEPIGLWFIDNKMTIDPEKISAARWVLQFSLLSFVVNLMSVPQMACITAHERMSAYAYIGVLDGFLRLAAALLISLSASDRLVLYSGLMLVSVVLVRLAYGLFCRHNFPDCRFRPVYDRGLLKEMFSFAGWSFVGSSSAVLRDQGGNILVNLFAGPSVNAARAVAFQLSGAVQNFVTNFMTAVNPQITKSYARGDHEYMFSLLRKSSRLSFYLLFVLALPVLFNTDFLLSLWLKSVPDTSAAFAKLFIIFALSESISNPLITAMLATGNIRNYQIVVGGLQLLNLPLSYVFLKIGCPPEVTVVVAIFISQICFGSRLFMLKKMIGLPVGVFLYRIYLNVLKIAATAVLLSYMVTSVLPSGIYGSCLSIILCFLIAGFTCLFIGMSSAERIEVMSMLKNRIRNDKDK